MSFKDFSSAQKKPATGKPAENSKGAPATDQPAAQPDKAPDNVNPETKS